MRIPISYPGIAYRFMTPLPREETARDKKNDNDIGGYSKETSRPDTFPDIIEDETQGI